MEDAWLLNVQTEHCQSCEAERLREEGPSWSAGTSPGTFVAASAASAGGDALSSARCSGVPTATVWASTLEPSRIFASSCRRRFGVGMVPLPSAAADPTSREGVPVLSEAAGEAG